MDSLPPFVILLAAFVDGPALVQIITDPRALSMPTLTGQQLRGFALALSKVVLNGGAGEVVQLARSNLRNIPRPRRSIWSTAC
jgi:pyruvate dehydrogenase (quinone)